MTWMYKSPLDLTLSAAGIEMLKLYEGEVTGVYNDSKGYTTFGIGSLIRKRNSILLHLAQSHKEIAKSYVKINKNTRAPYLDVGAAEDAKFEKIVMDLSKKTRSDGKTQIAEEWDLLGTDWDDYLGDRFKKDIEAKAKIVRANLGATRITQDQFDALISMSYNVAPEAAFWTVFKKFAEADRAYEETEAGRLEEVEARAAAFMSKILAYAYATTTNDVITGWSLVNGDIRGESHRVEPYKQYDPALSRRRRQEGACILGPRFSKCNRVCTTIKISRTVYIIDGENRATKSYDEARAKLDAARAAAKSSLPR